jgi:deazaflavin-dependent oxidoreductase (nitroreductase family)
MKNRVLQFLLRVATTKTGGRLLMMLITPTDRLLLRLSRGRYCISALGAPTLLLETTGRKSGQRRSTPLLYLQDQSTPSTLYIIGSRGGQGGNAGWALNLSANPTAMISSPNRTGTYVAERIIGDHRARIWRDFVNFNPGFAIYQARTSQEIPIFALKPKLEAPAKGTTNADQA